MESLLVLFGWVFVAAMLLAIVVPWLLRRSDLLTTWNLFLLGSANFVGFAAVQAGNATGHLTAYDADDYAHFIAGALVFYACLFLTYYRAKFPRRAAARWPRAWPPVETAPLLALTAGCAMAGLLTVFQVQVQGLAQILFFIGQGCTFIAAAYAVTCWVRRPLNPLLLAVAVAALTWAAVVSLLAGISRRELLGLIIMVVMCLYWVRYRYRPVALVAPRVAAVAVLGFMLIAGYSAIRHRKGSPGGAGRAVESLMMLPQTLMGRGGVDAEGLLGGDAVEVSLTTIHRYTKQEPPEPFYTIRFLAAQPIPRAFWPDKPEALGYKLPRDVGVWRRTGFVNWGPGIIGHGFHEGGVPWGYAMLVFYAVLVGAALRYGDDLLVRQPDNPYLLGAVGACSGQIVAFARGDISVFTVYIIAVVGTALVVRAVGRLFLGTGLVYLTDQQVLAARADATGGAGAAAAAAAAGPVEARAVVGAYS